MNRRTALLLSMVLGGLGTRSLRAQTRNRRVASSRDRVLEPASPYRDEADTAPADSDLPPALPREPGFQLRKFDISRYTRIAGNQANPQKALIDWIFLRTGVAEWHGDRAAVLSAN